MHALMPLDVHPDSCRVAFFNTQGFVFASAVEMVPARTADAFAIVRSFMASAPMFKWIYVLSGVWQGVGWSSIIFTAALAGVDKSLLEAADIDGATRIQKIWYVNVPVLIPTIVIMLILQCGSLLSVGYEKVYLLQNDFNMTAAEVISTYTYKVGLEQADFAFSTAVGVLNSVVNSIILIIVNAISRRVSETALW